MKINLTPEVSYSTGVKIIVQKDMSDGKLYIVLSGGPLQSILDALNLQTLDLETDLTGLLKLGQMTHAARLNLSLL